MSQLVRAIIVLLVVLSSSTVSQKVPPPTILPSPAMSPAEIAFIDDMLSSSAPNSLHVLEFGGGGSTLNWSGHSSVRYWDVIEHDPLWAAALVSSLHASGLLSGDRVSVSYVPANFEVAVTLTGGVFPVHGQLSRKLTVPADTTTTSSDIDVEVRLDKTEVGTLADFEKYVAHAIALSSIPMSSSSSSLSILVLLDGRARVDVGIALLPLLSSVRPGVSSLLLVHDWSDAHMRSCYGPVLLPLYDRVGGVETLSVLKARSTEDLQTLRERGTNTWCFSWGEQACVHVRDAPMSREDPEFEEVLSEACKPNEDGGHLFCLCNSGAGFEWTAILSFEAFMRRKLLDDEVEFGRAGEDITKICVSCSNLRKSVIRRAELLEKVLEQILG